MSGVVIGQIIAAHPESANPSVFPTSSSMLTLVGLFGLDFEVSVWVWPDQDFWLHVHLVCELTLHLCRVLLRFRHQKLLHYSEETTLFVFFG